MIIETKYSIGDRVWDLLLKRRTVITGIRVEKLKTSDGFSSQTLYTIQNALERTYRTEDELLEAENGIHA